MNNNIMISVASSNDLVEICDLMNLTFGPHPKQKEYFEKWITDSSFIVHVARAEQELIAVSTSYIKSSQDLKQYEVFGEEAIQFMKKNKLGWFLNLAVKPEFRKRKIGFELAKEQARWLVEKKCTALVGTSWVSGSQDNSAHLYQKAGFKKLAESNEFLRNQLRGHGHTCSACKKVECECVSILYAIEVDLLSGTSSDRA